MRKKQGLVQKGRLPALVTCVAALGVAALGLGLLTDAAVVADGVRRGLALCGGVLIPSLFPFMALSGFLSYTDYSRILSIPLRPITTRVFKLPGELGVVVLLSLIGGYPVGAKMIASLLEQGRINRTTAERMLCFCVNSGPSFLISAVGIGMFFDHTAGVILFATQTAATILVGWLVSLRVARPVGETRPVSHTPVSTALVLAVQGATNAMLVMCAFAVLFSGLLAMLQSGGAVEAAARLLPLHKEVITAVFSGLLEVTSGCAAASRVGGGLGFGLASAIVSFSGLSVLFQIFSCFGSAQVRFRPLVLTRIAHAGLSTALALPLYYKFCAHHAVWLAQQPPRIGVDGKTTLISVCILGMCTIFTLSLGHVSGFKK